MITLEAALAQPSCGCWDECQCGGGTKARVLADGYRQVAAALAAAEGRAEAAERVLVLLRPLLPRGKGMHNLCHCCEQLDKIREELK